MTTIIVPKKLAIFYSYPSTINSSAGNVTSAVNNFKQYDMVAFGEGLEQTTHPDHVKTVSIIGNSQMVNTTVFGYIDGTRSISGFENRVDLWKTIGAKGILVDKLGYDFNVTRAKQNTLIDYIHSKNMIAFVDVWNPDEVFSPAIDASYNPLGLACHMSNTDWYMAESYQIVNGAYQDGAFWYAKANKMINYRNTFGTKIACVTTYNTSAFDTNKFNYAYYSCVLFNFDAFAWGEYLFSATTSFMPYNNRPLITGTKFTNSIANISNVYQRNVNTGIHIDTTTHTVNKLLD